MQLTLVPQPQVPGTGLERTPTDAGPGRRTQGRAAQHHKTSGPSAKHLKIVPKLRPEPLLQAPVIPLLTASFYSKALSRTGKQLLK